MMIEGINTYQFVLLLSMIVGGVFWLARLESKANSAVEKYDLILHRFDGLEGQFDDLKNLILNAYLTGSTLPRTRP